MSADERPIWRGESLASGAQVNNIGEFPVRDEIGLGESGHGYVLRLAAANYLSGLPAIKKMLQKTRFTVLEDVDAPQIAAWFGADCHKLMLALGSTGLGKSEDEFKFCGHSIGRSYFVNRMYPRVCAACLADGPRCKSAWELSLSTACSIHGLRLLDSCPWCGDTLSWNRPSVTTCRCGRDLTTDAGACNSTPLENAISQWIAMKLNLFADDSVQRDGHTFQSLGLESSLARLLKPLTLGGGLQLIYALGTAQRSDVTGPYISPRKRSSIAAALDTLSKAETLVAKLIAHEQFDFRRSSISVVVNLLAEAAKASCEPADRSLMHSLIHVLLRQGARSNWKSRHPQLSQYEMF